MKLSKIRIKNFRNHIDSIVDFNGSKFCVLRGKNFSGKTSIAEAISLSLTKTTFGLDDRGAGFAKKIRSGESKASIEVDIQGANHLIRRTVNLSVSSAGRTQSSECLDDPSWMPAKFDRLLEEKRSSLNITLNTQAFQSMVYSNDEKEQKNLLASLVLPARYDFPKETIVEVESVLGEGTISFDREPFAVINQAYKKLFDARQDVNRKVKEFVVPDALPIPHGVNSALLQSKLSSLREERQKRSGERDDAVKQSNDAKVKKERTKARIETLEVAVRSTKEAISSLQGNILSNPDLMRAQGIADNREKRDSLIAKISSAKPTLELKKAVRDKLGKLEGGATCPTCEQEIDTEKTTNLLAKAIEEYNTLHTECASFALELSQLVDVDAAAEKIAKHNSAAAQKITYEKLLEDKKVELDSYRLELNKDISPEFDFSPFDKTLSDTDTKIDAIVQQLQPVIAAEERIKDVTIKREQLTRLEAKASLLDKLVKYFDKDGVKAKLISDHIGRFEFKVNEVLREWNYSCSLSIEPFRFEVIDNRGVSTPLIELSGAEEIMFYAAFQCAVSRTAGIGFVVIDRIDTLLPELRPALYKKLFQMTTEGTLDQVILLVADTSEQVPKLANSAFFAVEEGSVRRIG